MQKVSIVFLMVIVMAQVLFGYEAKNKNEILSAYIYLLAKNTSWPNSVEMDDFQITFVANDRDLYTTFKEVSQGISLKNKQLQVVNVDSIEDINYQKTQIIFINKSFESDLEAVYKKIGIHSILVMSEESESLEYSMINFYKDEKYRLNIELNLNNIQTHGLDINNKILLSSASTVGIGKLYHSSIETMKKQEKEFKKYLELNKNLQKEFKKYQKLSQELKQELHEYEQKIKSLNQDISDKTAKYNKTIKNISQKEIVIQEKKKLLQDKEKSIGNKESKIKELQKDLKILRKELSLHKKILHQKIQKIKQQQQTSQQYSTVLDEKLTEIKKLDEKILKQKNIIVINKGIQKEQKLEIQQKQYTLYLMGVIALLLFIFVIYIYRNKVKYQKLTQKLEIAKNDAVFANKAKSVFISKMSHELRTPLNAILGFSSLLLQKNKFIEEEEKALQTIYSSGSFLLALINDILDISSIESNKIIIHENPFNMKNVLNDVVLLVQHNADTKGLKLVVNYLHNGIECIKMDDKVVRQILLNIITNAIKYSEKGTIKIDVKLQKKRLFIEISDEGVGITKEDLKEIFEPFKQVGDASSSTGSGLGLAIVKQFIDIMNGEISVESVYKKGSSFKVLLPYSKCSKEDSIHFNTFDIKERVLGVTKESQQLRIMIVEDKENNILLLKMILEVLSFEIQVVKDGEEAVKKFKSFIPDLIFMDQRMPKMDGIEATKQIKAIDKDVKIIMLSANVTSKKHFAKDAPDEFLLKPYDSKDIYGVISKYFNVEYIYEQQEDVKKEMSGTFSKERIQDNLRLIDKKLLDELYQNARLLNSEDTLMTIHKIGEIDKEMEAVLQQFVKDIDFMSIIEIIEKVR